MAVTITLTPEPATASIDVLLEGYVDSTPVVVTRTGVDGSEVPLRGSPFTPSGGTIAVIDSEAPFGVPVRYIANGVTASTVLDVDVPWLTHPIAPFLSTPCVIEDDDDWRYPGRTYVFDVINRTQPVYTWYRRSSRTGTLKVAYANVQERTNIRIALETGSPLLIRYPASYPQFGSAYLGIGEARTIPRGVGSRMGVVEMDYTVVAAPPSDQAAPGLAWQWDDVPGEFGDWNTVMAYGFPSWNAFLFYNPALPNRTTTPFPGPQPRQPAPPLGS